MYRCDLSGPFHVAFEVMPSVRALNVGNFVLSESEHGGTSDHRAVSTYSSSSFAESRITAMSWVGLMFVRFAQSGDQSLRLRLVDVTKSVMDEFTWSLRAKRPHMPSA